MRLFARATWTPGWTTASLVLVLLGLAGLGQVLLASSLAPSPALFTRLSLGILAAGLPLSLAVGALAGVAGCVARLREERTLLGLEALGLAPRPLALLCATFALPVALAYAASTHFLEPLARALVRDTRIAAAAAVTPREDRPVRLGTWWAALEDGHLVFTDGARTGSAATYTLSARSTGVLAELRGVNLTLDPPPNDGVAAHLDALSLPLPLGHRGKVHVTERTTPDLLDQLVVSGALGRDGTERWLLWKRTLLPLMLIPLCVAAGGWARRLSPGLVVGGLMFSSWVGVRVLDGQIDRLGPEAASAVLLGAALFASAAAWRR